MARKFKPVGAGTALVGMLDAVSAANSGGKVAKDSPARGMKFGAKALKHLPDYKPGQVRAVKKIGHGQKNVVSGPAANNGGSGSMTFTRASPEQVAARAAGRPIPSEPAGATFTVQKRYDTLLYAAAAKKKKR